METDSTPARPVLDRLKRPILFVMGGAYVLAGVMHFVATRQLAQIVPPSLPRPEALVYLSGIAEITLGLGCCSAGRAASRPGA